MAPLAVRPMCSGGSTKDPLFEGLSLQVPGSRNVTERAQGRQDDHDQVCAPLGTILE